MSVWSCTHTAALVTLTYTLLGHRPPPHLSVNLQVGYWPQKRAHKWRPAPQTHSCSSPVPSVPQGHQRPWTSHPFSSSSADAKMHSWLGHYPWYPSHKAAPECRWSGTEGASTASQQGRRAGAEKSSSFTSSFLLAQESGSQLLSQQTFADPAAPRSLFLLLFPHLKSFLPVCIITMLSPEANGCFLPDTSGERFSPGAKQRLSQRQEQKSFPIPTSCYWPQTPFFGRRNNMHLISLLRRLKKTSPLIFFFSTQRSQKSTQRQLSELPLASKP